MKLNKQQRLLSKQEYDKIIYEWNNTDQEYPHHNAIHELIEANALKAPASIALVYMQEQLTYKELNEKSNQLARHIREEYKRRTSKKLTADTLIAICVEKSLEMVVGMLAVLKTGAAYVPIDPDYPKDRIDYILQDTKVELILSHDPVSKSNKEKLPQDKLLEIDLKLELYSDQVKSNLAIKKEADSLAYVIYTSGTTGKPKGTMLEHRNLINLVFSQITDLGINKESNILQFASIVFDASVWEIFPCLSAGATLFILSSDARQDINSLCDYLFTNKISLALLPPVLLANMPLRPFPFLKTLVVGGDTCTSETMNLWSEGRRLINAYGPTESTVIASMHSYVKGDSNRNIGRPLANLRMYVLDENQNPVPVGVKGELYIGGAGVARGYLNRGELTAARFISNPFATEAEKSKGSNHLYRTGDMVKWQADGNIEYIGRNDNQVKLRGYRIELEEIETVLLQIEGIKQACVQLRERKINHGMESYLVGYYVLSDPGTFQNEVTIHELLMQVLPAYMVPSALMEMKCFPLTINGKLDKGALPDPEFSFSETYVEASTGEEKISCRIWEEVLGIERVGTNDNFFRIGGTSVLAIQASHRMSESLKRDIKVADIFKHKTVSLLLKNTFDSIHQAIIKIDSSRSVLSFAQERLWFIEQYEEGTNAYHIPELYELSEDTNIEGIKNALQKVIFRHEVLRSTIEQGDGHQGGIQIIHADPLFIEEVSVDVEDDYEAMIRSDINRPFDLIKEYPIRVKLYFIQRLKSKSGQIKPGMLLLINTHHIASDGWSMEIFQKEFLAYYEAYLKKDTAFVLPSLKIQYKDYALWQREYLKGDILKKQLNYWKEKLAGYQSLELPTDYIRPAVVDYKGRRERLKLSKDVSIKLRNIAKELGVTLHSVMLGSVSILLGKYSGQQDIITGTPIANRHHRQTEGLIGFFANTQVNRVQLQPSQNYRDLILLIQQDQIEAQIHQDLPFEKLVEELGTERDTSRHSIFQVMFVVQNFGNQSRMGEKSFLTAYPLEGAYDVEKFDLSIFIDDSDEELVCTVNYSTSLFNNETIIRLIQRYSYLLDELTKYPGKPYSKIGLLNAEEYAKIIYEWNATEKEYPGDKTIHELFEEQVKRTPENIALVFDGKELSYQELNEKSNQLAHRIREQYGKRTTQSLVPDSLIALYLDRGLEMIIGILAVLKAGGAYVPIDPRYPKERVAYMLENSKAEIILSMRQLHKNDTDKLPHEKIIYIDLSESLYISEDSSNLPSVSKPTDLAYVLYTSGTTGRPKGVMLEHFSLVNRLCYIIHYSSISKEDVHLFKTNYVFDVSFFELFTNLCTGARIHVTKSIYDIDEIHELLSTNKFTSMHLVPSQYEPIAGILKQVKLKKIYFSGEALTERILQETNKAIKIINYYGPTEAGEITAYTPLVPSDSSIIGKTFPNTRMYVLDPGHVPVPIGIAGELYISGTGIARGYLDLPELTRERFIQNPFASEEDKSKGYGIMYKTGDLVKWLPDGNLLYIGRNDDQVKIRGYRIELNEVELALSRIEGIQAACVLVKERKSKTGIIKYLAGYYVLSSGHASINQSSIQEKLQQVLPDFMLPDTLTAMESFPLTVNGKLDRRSLPEEDFNSAEAYIEPTTDEEIICCTIWLEILGSERIGITDNFFRIGGNSILAIQVSHQMSKALRCDVKVADIFKYKTIKALLENMVSPEINGIKWTFEDFA